MAFSFWSTRLTSLMPLRNATLPIISPTSLSTSPPAREMVSLVFSCILYCCCYASFCVSLFSCFLLVTLTSASNKHGEHCCLLFSLYHCLQFFCFSSPLSFSLIFSFLFSILFSSFLVTPSSKKYGEYFCPCNLCVLTMLSYQHLL